MTRTTNKPRNGEYRITILDRPLLRKVCHNNERPDDSETLNAMIDEVDKVTRWLEKTEAKERARDRRAYEMKKERERRKQ
jgi:hypothetical protein